MGHHRAGRRSRHFCLPDGEGGGGRLPSCLGKSPGRGHGLFAKRRVEAQEEVARIYGELLHSEDMAGIPDPSLRDLVQSDALCNSRGVCVSPRDPRTGRRLAPPDADHLGVYVNEPADRLPRGFRPLRAPKGYLGPFRANVHFEDTMHSLLPDGGEEEVVSWDPALHSGARGFARILASARLRKGEELTACYDSGRGASQGEGYFRHGYRRPRCCWEDQESCMAAGAGRGAPSSSSPPPSSSSSSSFSSGGHRHLEMPALPDVDVLYGRSHAQERVLAAQR